MRDLRHVSPKNASDQTLKIAIKNLMQAYKKLIKKKGGLHDEKLSVFLSATFVLYPPAAPQLSSSSQDETSKVLVKREKEILRLKEIVKLREEENAVLKETASEMSTEIAKLQVAAQTNQTYLHTIENLRRKVLEQKQNIRELQPQRFRRQREKLIDIRRKQRATQRTAIDVEVRLTTERNALAEELKALQQAHKCMQREVRRQKVREQAAEIKNLLEENARLSGKFSIKTREKKETDLQMMLGQLC